MKEEGINSEILSIVERIIRKYKPLKIILFGSAARGERSGAWSRNSYEFREIASNNRVSSDFSLIRLSTAASGQQRFNHLAGFRWGYNLDVLIFS
jgi:hypothetical protein